MSRLFMRCCTGGTVFGLAVGLTVGAQPSGGTSAQEMLDFLAKALPANSRMALPATYPSRFTDWSEAQKQPGLQLVTQRCALIFALEHDNPAARMIPQSMTRREEAELAMAVCLPAKMPPDWTERRKNLDDAQRLITKANAAGGALHMPETLPRDGSQVKP